MENEYNTYEEPGSIPPPPPFTSIPPPPQYSYVSSDQVDSKTSLLAMGKVVAMILGAIGLLVIGGSLATRDSAPQVTNVPGVRTVAEPAPVRTPASRPAPVSDRQGYLEAVREFGTYELLLVDDQLLIDLGYSICDLASAAPSKRAFENSLREAAEYGGVSDLNATTLAAGAALFLCPNNVMNRWYG